MTTEVVVVTTTNTVVTENTATNVVEVTASGTTPTVDIIAEGPAGPPGGSLTIQDQGISEGLLTDKLNFAGSTVSVVNDTINEVATVTVNAATPGANTNITSLGGITGGISSPDFIQFDTAAAATGAVGRMLWNDTDGTLEFQMKGGNVTLQVGQEQVLRVTNQSGATMVDGQVVYITGSTGNHLNVTLSQANSEMTSSKTLAVVTETIANNQSGFATTSGLVRNFNTSALTEGEAIWLSPTVPGGLTSTKPVAPNHAVLVGWCVRQHASVGVIYVHIANGYELQELHNVLITAVVNNQVLRYDSATSLWKNVTISPTVTLTGAVTGSGTMTDLGSVSIATTATADPTLTLAGDATGSATFTNLGDATLTVTVVDDSHNHIISNVDGLQDALDLKAPLASPTFTGTVTLPSTTSVGTVSATEIGYLDGVTSGIQAQIDSKLPSASYTAADVLTKIKTVDGVGSGLDADLLDGESGTYYLDFTNATNKPDPTITLSGDATGSVTLTDLASGTLSVTVVDDSHNHVISNVDGLQDALDSKLAAADYTAADVLTKIKTVDGAGSGLDADLLDGQSSAYYTAINDRLGYTAENAANKGVANGYASLDGAGLVPSTQLPSYVDDVVEYANVAAFPATGESGKIYVAIDTSKTYRWTGSVYVEISASPGTTDSLTEGSVNLYFTTARARQSVSAGTGISYDNSTGVITNSSPDQTVALTAGTGISTSGAYPNFTITNSAPDQTVALTGSGTTSISGTYPNFTVSSADQYVGTVTSVAALTLGTTGTDLSSSVANGTTTPVITLNVPTASASNRGALSSTDWSTFNGKQAALVSGTNIKTVGGVSLLGSGDAGTIGVPYGGTGVTTSTGTGSVVLSNSPTLVTPILGSASATIITNALGSAAAPSYTFTGDTDTGVFSPGANTVSISTGGAEQLRVTNTASAVNYVQITGSATGGDPTISAQGSDTDRNLKLTAKGTGAVQTTTRFEAQTGAANYWRLSGGATTVAPVISVLGSDANITLALATKGTGSLTVTTNGSERFRVDGSGNVGIGTSSPSNKLDVFGTSTTIIRSYSTGTASSTYAGVHAGTGEGVNSVMYSYQSAGWYGTTSNHPMLFMSNNSERMRLDTSGNVGIGTTSPGYPLTVQANSTSGAIRMVGRTSDGTATLEFVNASQVSTNAYIQSASNNMVFATSTTERMRIDSSGNVGIGTSSPTSRLTITGGVTEIRDGNYLMLRPSGNAWDMRLQATGTQLDILSGGSLGSPIMSLLNGGNVGIGTNSPASLLHVKRGSNATEVYPTGTWASRIINATDASAENGLVIGNRWAATTSTVFEVGSIFGGGTGSWRSFYKVDGVGNSIWANDGTERMRLTTSGTLALGLSSPNASLHINGARGGEGRLTQLSTANATAADALNIIASSSSGGGDQWYSWGVTSGNVWRICPGVGLGSSEAFSVNSNSRVMVGSATAFDTTVGANFMSYGSAGSAAAFKVNATASTQVSFYDSTQSARVGWIGTSGSSTSYNTTSDRRLKQNIQPVGDVGDKIDQIEVVSHGWTNGTDAVIPYAFIAQDLYEAAPHAVSKGDDGEEVSVEWAVDYSKLVPMLVKELQSVRARLSQLEGK